VDILDKIARIEQDFFSSHFISPTIRGQPIRVRISGIVMNFMVDEPFNGWGIFRPINGLTAKFVREPTMSEKRAYLNLFPSMHLIVYRKINNIWFGILSNRSDRRFRIDGFIPIHLANDIELFDMVCVRYDGSTCWFDSPSDHYDPSISIYLRNQLNKFADNIEYPGISPEFYDAYMVAYGVAAAADTTLKKDRIEERLKSALHRAGAIYKSYSERSDAYTVEYVVNGENYKSIVSKDNLSVQSAGICLSGDDKKFDLQSLIGVIREGQSLNAIVRV